MIDLHTHSLFSDGELIPAELARRARVKGYRGLAITDHADSSNLDLIIPRLVRFCETLKPDPSFQVIPGIEITHVEPDIIVVLTQAARKLGARLVVMHGETIAEPVAPGTNRAALEAGVDVLAHPGLISEEEVMLARDKGIMLEVSARKGHCLTNGHVVRLAKECNASLVLNTDSHGPDDLIDDFQARRVALGAGLTDAEWERMQENSRTLLARCLSSL
jgi:putative hydrolase